MNINNNSTAYANIKGSSKYPNLHGTVFFEQMRKGVLVTAKIFDLPYTVQNSNPIHGFHIHEGTECTGNSKDEFKNTGMHLNLNNAKHPYHTGDMPPLFSNNGYAYMSFFTNKFTINDILNKTVIIHSNPDDFTTQPSGNSGEKIACGIITH